MVFDINLVQLCVSATDPGTDTRCTEDPKLGGPTPWVWPHLFWAQMSPASVVGFLWTS